MKTKDSKSKVDFSLLVLPLVIIVVLTLLIFVFPVHVNNVMSSLREILVNKLGFFYILLGLLVVGGCLYVAISPHGKIQLGPLEKPKYSNHQWGAMIFTSTMAADILYWSLIEWVYYYAADPMGAETLSLAERQRNASAYPLFHWGPIPWAFYLLPAAAYAYMFFVRNRPRQRLSEACRPTLGDAVDKMPGKLIDILAVVGLLAGTATTFSLATPLLSGAISYITGIPDSKMLSMVLLVLIGIIFTVTVLYGMKAISKLANISVFLFVLLLCCVFFLGPKIFTIESGITGIGQVAQNFISMATWTDPMRVTGISGQGFPQQWTIFYWAYWISWFVATPFFIAKISEGRSLRQMIFGGFFYGIAGTFTSFIVFGNFGLYQQVSGNMDAASMIAQGASPSQVIISLFEHLKGTKIILALLAIAMISFYASNFDATSIVVAGFTQKNLAPDEEPSKGLRAFWSILFVLLPSALIWSESTLDILQTLSIIVAFPLGIIMLIIIISFFKELKNHNKNFPNNS